MGTSNYICTYQEMGAGCFGGVMAKDVKKSPLEFLWFFPTMGDVRFFGRDDGTRKVDNFYLRELALALDRLGYFGALLPTGNFCEDALVVATSLVTHTQRLRFLIALRPGSIVPENQHVRPPRLIVSAKVEFFSTLLLAAYLVTSKPTETFCHMMSVICSRQNF